MADEDISSSSAEATEGQANSPQVASPEPTTSPQEASPAPKEVEPIQSEPIATPTVEAQPFNEAQDKTAQLPANEPFDSAHDNHDKPLPVELEPIVPETQPAPAPAQSAPPPRAVPSTNIARDLLVKARAMFQNRKQKKLGKIMERIAEEGHITNDEVEKLLHVSDATATRYLSALEKEGKIRQVGKTGTGVAYVKV